MNIHDGGSVLGQAEDPVVAVGVCKHGVLRYPRDDRPIGLSLRMYGEWLEGEAQLLHHLLHPGDLYVDLGAHVGALTVAALSAVGSDGQVIAFEASPSLLALLKENLATADSGRFLCSAFPSDLATLSIALSVQPEPFERSLVRIGASAPGGTIVQALDGFLEQTRPVVLARVRDVDDLVAILLSRDWVDYRPSLIRTRAFNPHNFRGESDNAFGFAQESSVLLLPQEREGDVPSSIPGVSIVPFDSLDQAARTLILTPREGDHSDHDRDPAILQRELTATREALERAELRAGAMERRVLALLDEADKKDLSLQEAQLLITDMATSRSWRVTAPLRSARSQR